MEHRFAALEARADRVETKLDTIQSTLTDIRVDLAKKPTTNGLWGMIATVLALAIAIALGTFTVAEYASNRAADPPSASQAK